MGRENKLVCKFQIVIPNSCQHYSRAKSLSKENITERSQEQQNQNISSQFIHRLEVEFITEL
jgi:hypothetical protein